jgi:hypothetical protein
MLCVTSVTSCSTQYFRFYVSDFLGFMRCNSYDISFRYFRYFWSNLCAHLTAHLHARKIDKCYSEACSVMYDSTMFLIARVLQLVYIDFWYVLAFTGIEGRQTHVIMLVLPLWDDMWLVQLLYLDIFCWKAITNSAYFQFFMVKTCGWVVEGILMIKWDC